MDMTQVVSAARPAPSSRAVRALSDGVSALEIMNSMPTTAEYEESRDRVELLLLFCLTVSSSTVFRTCGKHSKVTAMTE